MVFVGKVVVELVKEVVLIGIIVVDVVVVLGDIAVDKFVIFGKVLWRST